MRCWLERKRQVQEAFTFMELAVSVMILGILMTLSFVAYKSFADSAKQTATRANLQSIQSGVDLFYLDQSRYPTKLEDLVERPQGDLGKNWKQYLKKLPKDGWKSDFYYKVNPTGSKNPYELYSYGPNGPEAPTDEGRISVWDL